MDFFKASQSLGDILYEFAVSLVLIPRTLFKVLRSPAWATTYVSSQSKEKPKIRFEKYSNPILFWIIIGVLSYYFLFELLFFQYADKPVLEVYRTIGLETKIGSFIVFFIALPLSFAIVIHLFRHRSFEKSTFKRSFFIQCYITAPLQLFYIPSFFIDEFSEFWSTIGALVVIGIVVWFLIAEFIISKRELECGWFKAICMLCLMYISYFVFVSITTVIFIFMNLDTFQKLLDAWIGDINLPS